MKILLTFFVLFFSSTVVADTKKILYENDFPNDLLGVWAGTCDQDQFDLSNGDKTFHNILLILYDYGALYIYDWVTPTSINHQSKIVVTKTAQVNGFTTVSKNIFKTSFPNDKNFFKYADNQLFITTKPEIEFGNDISIKKCDQVPSRLMKNYKILIDFSKSDVINSCFFENRNLEKCISDLFEFIDITNDLELSEAEIAKSIKALLFYYYLNEMGNIEKIELSKSNLKISSFALKLSEKFIKNYDYDDSQSISIDELKSDINEINSLITLLDLEKFSSYEILSDWLQLENIYPEINNLFQIRMNQDEINILNKQLSSCFFFPVNIEIKKDMFVKVTAKVNKEKKVVWTSVVHTNIPESYPYYQQIITSVKNIFLDPNCSTLNLPDKKNHDWETINLTFDNSVLSKSEKEPDINESQIIIIN